MASIINAKRMRPNMKEYGIAKEEKGMLDWEWVDKQAEKSRNYWVSSTKPDGNPHAAPVWGVWTDNTLYFSTGANSRKARNLTRNPEVVVHLESGDEVVIIEGRIEEKRVAEGMDISDLQRMAELYGQKYAGFKPELKEGELYYILRPRVVFAWLEKDFPTTATRWEFEK